MKYSIFLWCCLLALFSACNDSEPSYDRLSLSAEKLGIGGEGGRLDVKISCNGNWQVSGATAWCAPDKTRGKGDAALTLRVAAHEDAGNDRRAILTVSSGTQSRTLMVVQGPSLPFLQYKLPVIFHVLRAPGDREEIREGWIEEIVRVCNENYKGLRGASPNIGVEFVLAGEKPDGTPLETPGLEYVSWPTSTIDCDDWMDQWNPIPGSLELQWDLDKYINIYVYDFGTGANRLTGGISFFPYTVSSRPLAGLVVGDVYLTRKPRYMHCVSLNRRYFYNRSLNGVYDEADITVNLTHELGHYLGLLHPFSTEKCGDGDDYCADTPDYNRSAYMSWLQEFMKNSASVVSLEQLARRTACDGTTFISRNFMDYSFSYSDQFTASQAQRIRYVLSYSPLVPGPKYKRSLPVGKRSMEIPVAIKMP